MKPNPYSSYRVLTFFIIDQPLDVVVEAWWHDFVVRKRDFSDVPQRLIDALQLDKGEDISKWACRRQVPFDLGWAYRVRPTEVANSALFWQPCNAPGYTAVMVNSSDGHPTFFASSFPFRDWHFFWTFIDDVNPEQSVCRFQFTRDHEAVYREVWAGRENDEESKARWRFDRCGPVQPFEKPNNYRAARVQDRLTRSIVGSYCSRLGCDIASDRFWMSEIPAWVVWRNVKGDFPDPPFHAAQ